MDLHRNEPGCDCHQVIVNVTEAESRLLNFYCRTAEQLGRI